MNITVLNQDGWRTHEAKELRIQVLDASGLPVSLTNPVELALRWVLRRQSDCPDVLTKTTADGSITIEDADEDANDQSVAVISIEEGEIIDPNVYWHALRDDTAGVMLGYGDAYIGPGVAPPEEG